MDDGEWVRYSDHAAHMTKICTYAVARLVEALNAQEAEIIALRALLFGCADAMQDADLDATMMSKRTRENFYAAKDLALDHLGERTP